MKVRNIHNPQHWRNRAEEIRTISEMVHDECAKGIMHMLAGGYDDLAVAIEKAAGSGSQEAANMVNDLKQLMTIKS